MSECFNFRVYQDRFCVSQAWSDRFICWADISAGYLALVGEGLPSLQNLLRGKGVAAEVQAVAEAEGTTAEALKRLTSGRVWIHPIIAKSLVDNNFPAISEWFSQSFIGIDNAGGQKAEATAKPLTAYDIDAAEQKAADMEAAAAHEMAS